MTGSPLSISLRRDSTIIDSVFAPLDKVGVPASEQGISFGFGTLPTDPEEVAT